MRNTRWIVQIRLQRVDTHVGGHPLQPPTEFSEDQLVDRVVFARKGPARQLWSRLHDELERFSNEYVGGSAPSRPPKEDTDDR